MPRGAGLRDALGRFIGGARDHASPQLRKQLENDGHKHVYRMWVARTPVETILQVVLDLASSGRWSAARRSLDANQVFHVALLLEMSDGQVLRLEKNAVVLLSPYHGSPVYERMEVPVVRGRTVSLQQLLEAGERYAGQEAVHQYDPFRANCQDFALAMLRGLHSLGTVKGTATLDDFVEQDSTVLERVVGLVGRLLADGTTGLAGHFTTHGTVLGFEAR